MMNVVESIIKKAPSYGLVAEKLNHNTVKLYSKKYLFDSWLIKVYETKVELLHANKKRNGGKCSYHKQNSFKIQNYTWALRKIKDHNTFTINKKHYKRTNWVDDVLKRHNERINLAKIG